MSDSSGPGTDRGRSADGATHTYDLALLVQSHARWQASPALRACYEDLYRAMAAWAPPGPALEVGSGCGSIRSFIPGVVTSDVRKTRFVDLAVSAYEVEAAAGGPWAAIYALDVLHHLRDPLRFFASAVRALRPGGRLVVCDPAATFFGRAFYRCFHHEPIAPARVRAPYEFPADSAAGDFANMGMAWAMFVRDRTAMDDQLRRLGARVAALRFRDVLAYPATGGFSGPRLLPAVAIRGLLAVERRLPQRLLRALGLRMLVVLERTGE